MAGRFFTHKNAVKFIIFSVFSFLPDKIKLEVLKIKNVTEIRIRANAPVFIYTINKIIKLNKFKITEDDINLIVLNACKRSVYGYDEYIRNGFITTDYGIRIGLAGEIVYDDNKVLTIKKFTSLCIRVPNNVEGISNEFFKVYTRGSILVVSKNGVGKTTYLRDITRNLSTLYQKNVVVIDERNEISAKNGNNSFNLGDTVDVLSFANKNYGFTHALRTLNPSVIITDELITDLDFLSVTNAVKSGIEVVASMHGDCISCTSNGNLLKFIKEKIFNYYVLISIENGVRSYKIYDENLNLSLCY